jgi:hypothetical protein
MSASISNPALPVQLPSQPSISKAYTPLFLFLRSLGNPSQWITCLACCPPSKEMTVFVVVDQFLKMAILTAFKKNVIAADTAKLFFERVWVHFGIPQTIISD